MTVSAAFAAPALALAGRVDGLKLRERMLLLGTVVVLLYAGWSQGPMHSLGQARDALAADVERLHREITALHGQMGSAIRQRSADPDAGNRRRLEELRTRNDTLTEALGAFTERLIPPERMGAVLESVLGRRARLALVSLEGLGAMPISDALAEKPSGSAPVAESSAGSAGESAGGQLYRHGLRVSLEGDYLGTLEYLRDLEGLPWNLLWERVEFEVQIYPRARVDITVHSLSYDADWIGV